MTFDRGEFKHGVVMVYRLIYITVSTRCNEILHSYHRLFHLGEHKWVSWRDGTWIGRLHFERSPSDKSDNWDSDRWETDNNKTFTTFTFALVVSITYMVYGADDILMIGDYAAMCRIFVISETKYHHKHAFHLRYACVLCIIYTNVSLQQSSEITFE